MINVVKAISAVLGIMIFLTLGVLGYAFYTSDEKPQEAAMAETSVSSVPVVPQVQVASAASAAEFGEISLQQPEGSQIISVQPQGHLVFVTVRGGVKSTGDRVLVVDLLKRRVVGQLVVGTIKQDLKQQTAQ